LRSGASEADGVIHTAFYHQIGHIPLKTRLRVLLGGAPTGIVTRFGSAAVGMDRRALETVGKALEGTGRPILAIFATLGLKPGRLATENDTFDPNAFAAPRSQTEELMKELASRGVRTSIVRLPPIVHGVGDRGGFAPQLIQIARKKKESAYVGDGANRWAAVHRLDVARLFRLALEKGPAGGTYHGVAEEGMPFRDIANFIGKHLNVPVVSKSSAEAAKQFSFLAPFIAVDNPVSSKMTREQLGWRPTESSLFSDLSENYF
jgi:nucleoside-diphosphate-sugar epimerase